MATDPNAAVYDALRKADAAGDSEAVARLSQFLKGQEEAPAPVDFAKDQGAFNVEVRKRFQGGASADDLEQFAKSNGYELRGLANAVAYPDRNAVGVVGQAATDGTPGVVHMLRGGVANLLGPQLSRVGADMAGAAGGEGGVIGRRIAADADREEFANNHPWLSTGLNIAGSIPAAMGRGGAALLGGITGALQSDDYSATGIGMDAAAGAAGGLVGDRVVRAASNVLAPRIAPYARRILDAGGYLSPGQTFRNAGGGVSKFLSGLEDRASGLPWVGPMIQADRERANASFVNSTVKPALERVGEQLPPVENGNQAVGYTRRAMTRAYDRATSQMQLLPDDQLVSDLAAVAARRTDGTLSGDSANQLSQTARSVIGNRPMPLDGAGFKRVDSELRKRAGAATDPALKGALNDMRQAVRDAAFRSSPPEAGAALQNADEAYGYYTRARQAAQGATEGNFTPGQYESAVRQADTSIGNGQMAAGEALNQQAAIDARRQLPSRIGSSGTSERTQTLQIIPNVLGGIGAGVYAGARAVTPFLSREAGAQSQAAADLLRRSAPVVGASVAPYVGPPAINAGLMLGMGTAGGIGNFGKHLAGLAS